VVQPELNTPPLALIEPTAKPALIPAPTWRDIAIHAARLDSALAQCNADKALMRDWYKELEQWPEQ
jgi:hypothetical protein